MLLLVLAAGLLLFWPAAKNQPLSPAAQALVAAAFADVPGQTLIDYHAHLAGLGTDSSGAWVNPRFRSPGQPASWFRFRAYLSVAGVTDAAHADREYVATLAARAREFPVPLRLGILAFDYVYRADGARDTAASNLFVPNDYVLRVAREYPGVFFPVASVHPYRRDAVAELDRCAAAGVRLVKLIPNVQLIDYQDTRCLPFYQALVRNRMTLLTHAGDEKAFGGEVREDYGNPLRLRAPLAAGCTVIVAHCAAEGDGDDFDQPGRRAPNLELFLRLYDDPRYVGQLWGEISALPQVNRAGAALPELLPRADRQQRLVNGSDYPLPGVDALYSAYYLAARGYLNFGEARLLEEIQRHNPLLGDYVLKRTLTDPVTRRRFARDIFTIRPGLPVIPPSATMQGGREEN